MAFKEEPIETKKIIIISPHPDDETLGCGGTLLKHKSMGDEIYWLIMTNISCDEGFSEERVISRQQEIDHVVKEYGFNDIFKLNYPTIKLDQIPSGQLVQSIKNVLESVKPDVVYLPYKHDAHSDHKITFNAAVCSVKTFRYPFIKKILIYEVVSETEFGPSLQGNAFVPNSFSDISEFLEKKIKIVKLYEGEVGEHPFPRSVENLKALATFRGATAGVKYAEAFMVLKEIW